MSDALALQLLAQNPRGLGGLHLRARHGPARDAVLHEIARLFPGAARIHPAMNDGQLFGGPDIAATLSAGRLVLTRGLLSDGAVCILSMAERCSSALAARLCQALDSGQISAVILLDEGAEPDEAAPRSLTNRCAFRMSPVGGEDFEPALPSEDPVALSENAIAMLVVAAARFGIDDLRALILAVAAARAHASLFRRDVTENEDLQAAAELVFAHRATQIPADEDDTPEEESPDDETPDQPEDDASTEPQTGNIPQDMLIEAIKAALPDDILQALAGGQSGSRGQGSTGQARKGNRRGRPLPGRKGRPNGQARIDLMATLRAAAPWQTIRRRSRPDHQGLIVLVSDLHVRQFKEHSDRLVIFAVDASGSAAMARLAEAKGAVELLLAEAYARRDHVALVTFRGTRAELSLPPTRSLVQTKRRLSGLPGGGGTPLASGLQIVARVVAQARMQGLNPAVALLTDGRANVALDGTGNRAMAQEDTDRMAAVLRAMNVPIAVLDTAVRPQKALAKLSEVLAASYLPLPAADSRRMSQAVTSTLLE